MLRGWLLAGLMVVLTVGSALGAQPPIVYQEGEEKTEDLVLSSSEEKTLVINSTGFSPAAQSGDISSSDDTAKLTIVAGTGVASPTLRLTGDNSGYSGEVDFQGGILEIGASNSLFGKMSAFSFGGDFTGAALGDVAGAVDTLGSAVESYVYSPTYATGDAVWNAMSAQANAVNAAQASGALPTLQIGAGSLIEWDGDFGANHQLVVESGKAGAFHVGNDAKLVFRNHIGSASDRGGAITVGGKAFLALTSDPSGRGYLFEQNFAAYTGGAISNTGGTVMLSNALFWENMAETGGAFYNNGSGGDKGVVTLTDVRFDNNVAEIRGGAIYNNSTMFLSGGAFFENKTDGQGGAIFNDTDGILAISDVVFENNNLGVPGVGKGGAIYNSGSMLLNNTMFLGNIGSEGGAIYNDGGNVTIFDAAFRWNSSVVTHGGAIYSDGGTVSLVDTVFTGNTVENQCVGGAVYADSGAEVSIGGNSFFANNIGFGVYLNANAGETVSLTVAPDFRDIVDMRDPMGGAVADASSAIVITKSGDGTWKLGGESKLTGAIGKTDFTVEHGTLHLYGKNEVDIPEQIDGVAAGIIGLSGSNSTFTLRSDATLSVGGGTDANGIYITSTAEAGGTAQGTITIDSGATLAFDLGNHPNADAQPMLSLKADTIAVGGPLTVDLLSLAKGTTDPQLLVKKEGGSAFQGASLTLRGETIQAGSRASELNLSLNVCSDTITLNQDAPHTNKVLDWTGQATSNWSITGGNWREQSATTTFLHGDIVNFTADSGNRDIVLNSGGVQVAGMYLSGDGDYTFSGGSIIADAVGGTSFSGGNQAGTANAANGSLVLGAKAVDGSPNPTVETVGNAFTGVLDFTGTDNNHFLGGILLNSGELKISSFDQLGLHGSRPAAGGESMPLYFNADASAVGLDELKAAIADGSATYDTVTRARQAGSIGVLHVTDGSIVFMNDVDVEGRLVVDSGKAGAIHIGRDSGMSFKCIKDGADYNGGALAVENGALLVLTADADGGGYFFDQKNALQGGAIFNSGTILLSHALFLENWADTGGAIYNDSNGILTLTDVAFESNSAGSNVSSIVTNHGGALYTAGVATLINTTFQENSAEKSGGAIHTSGILTIKDSFFIDNITVGNGGAIYAGAGSNTTIMASSGGTTLFTGNTEIGQANSVHLVGDGSDATILNINVESDGVVDMRDPVHGELLTTGSEIALEKTGQGVWKLGGTSVLSDSSFAAGNVSFAVNQGTLQLYRQDEVENFSEPGSKVTTGIIDMRSIQNGSFAVASGATLNVGGGNSVMLDNTAGNSITLAVGSTVGFDIGNFSPLDASVPTTGLTLSANTIDLKDDGTGILNFSVDLTSFSQGSYILVDAGAGALFQNIDLVDAGERLTLGGAAMGGRFGATLNTANNGEQLILETTLTANTELIWSGTNGSTWGTANNWVDNQRAPETFAQGDTVVFTADSARQNVIVGTNSAVAGMEIRGGDYVFSGGKISSTGTVVGTNVPPSEKLVISGGSAVFNNEVAFQNGLELSGGSVLFNNTADFSVGGVNVTGGSLTIGTGAGTANVILKGDVTVGAGCGVGGYGTVDGNVTLQTGATIDPSLRGEDGGGVFAITGSLTMANGSGYVVSGLHTVAVSGNANLSDVVFSGGTGIASNTTYTVLSAGSITGWTGSREYTTAFLRYVLDAVYDSAGDDELRLTSDIYRQVGDLDLDPNQQAVLDAVESWSGGSNELYDAILNLGTEREAFSALSLLNGQSHANLASGLLRYGRGFWELLEGPVLSLRDSGDGEGGCSQSALASLHPRAASGRGPLFWFSGGRLYSRSRSDRDTARDKLSGTDFKAGGEVRLGGWNLGAAFRYGDTRLKVNDRASRSDIDSYQFGVYTTHNAPFGFRPLRFTLGLSGGYHEVDSRRRVAFGEINQSLNADYHAWSLSAIAEAGYRMTITPRIAVEPYLAMGWDSVWTSSFTESGGSAALRGRDAHQGNLSSTLGTRTSYSISQRVSVDANLGWRHTFGRVHPHSSFAFVRSPTRDRFTAVGSRLARDEFVGNFGVRVNVTERAYLRADYSLEAGNGGIAHRGMLTAGLDF